MGTTHSILQEKIWMLPIIFTCTHCTHRTLHPHQSKQPTMTGLYVSIIFTCTHRTHRTLYPQLLERKNMDALYFFGLHTSHTLPTASCKKNMDATYYFHLHTLHTPHTLPTSVQTTQYDRIICVYYFHLHTHTHTHTHTHIHTDI